ncbi:BON domain-containing protein [Thiogranum longum]|uniref:BON domain-containing protein n=1 Tax=Thiogranum longum TaxID=1537524 RepID=A0A4R1HI64_9GAMM|nr:BON domain-containing protein [Thiogranum longum]TCK19109.1 BON domain-containing protein [Thiogranum longum]
MRVLQHVLVVLLLAGALSACGSLIVSGQAQGGRSSATASAAERRDAAITAEINRQFVRDAQISAFDVRIDTRNGVVRLSGQVRDTKAKQRALELARSVDGVRRVESSLTY